MSFDVSEYDPLSQEMVSEELSSTDARRLRLRYADRLEQDIRQARAAAPGEP